MVEPSSSAAQPSNKPVFPLDRQEAFQIAAEEHKSALAEYAADVQRTLESVRAANESGSEAIKAATLINGGAAVAMLAFVGHLASIQAVATVIMGFAKPLRLFVVGTLLGVVASGLTYLAQSFFTASLVRDLKSKEAKREDQESLATRHDAASVTWRRIGQVTNFTAVLTVVAALVCFSLGCYVAYQAFQSGITLK